MAILSNLLVNGESRLLGKLYTNDIEIGNDLTVSGKTTTTQLVVSSTVNQNKNSSVNSSTGNLAVIIGSPTGKHIAMDSDEIAAKNGVTTSSALWLNYGGGAVNLSTDAKIVANNGTLTAPTISNTTLTSTTATITTGNITTANTNNIYNTGNIYNKNGRIETDVIRSNVWDIVSTQNLGGSFIVAPTIMIKDGSTVTITSVSGTTIVGSIKDTTNITSDSFGGHTWSQNSKIKITGKLTSGNNHYVLGTCDGTLTAKMNTTSNTINFSVTCNASTLPPNGTYTITGGTVMMYNVGGSNLVGIELTSYGTDKYTYIDIYNGSNGIKPVARLGKLDNLSTATYGNIKVNGDNLTGYGIYTNNGFFEGKIVSSSGKIGGFNIGTSAIYSTTNALGTTANNVYIGTEGISLGTTFKVTKAGAITATSGTIGNFTLGAAIYSGTDSISSTTAGVYLGTDGIRNYNTTGSKHVTIKDGTITANSVDLTGVIKATSGFIGQNATNGFTISNTAIYNPSTKSTLGSDTVDGIYIGKDGIALGKGVFKVTNAGAVTAGNITATGGTIGGFKIDTTSIRTNDVAVTSNADNSISLSSTDFTRTILSTSRAGLRFAIGDKFGVTGDGVLYTNGANITSLNADNITTGTLSAERIAVTDFTNYCQLNPNTAALYGWTLTQDSSNPNTPWYVRDTLGRDNYPSTWFDCKPGDMFKVSMTVSSTVTGATQSGGAGGTYMSINLGVQCQTATGSSNWPTLGIATSNASGTETTKTGYVTIPTSAEYIKFRAFIQIGGVAPFAGTLKIRNPVIKRVGADEYITYINSTDGIKVHNSSDATDYLQVNSTAIKMYRNNTQKMYLDDSKLQFTNGSTVLAEYGSTVTIGETGTGKYNTYIDGNAVYMRKATTNLSKFDGDGVYFYDGSTITSQFTKNGITVGKTSSNHILLSPNNFQLKNNGTVLADFGSTITLGQTTGQAAVINGDGMQLYQNGYNIASFGENIDLLNLSIYGSRGTMLIHSPISNDNRITHTYDHLYIESEVEEFVDYLISPRIKLQDILVDKNDTNTGDCKTIVISPQVGIDVNTASVLITPSGNISCQNIYCDGNLLCNNIKCGAIVGQSVPANSYKDYSVTFDSSFDDIPIVVVGIRSDLTYANIGNVSVATSNPTANGFVARVFNGSNTARNVYMHWIATTSGMQS